MSRSFQNILESKSIIMSKIREHARKHSRNFWIIVEFENHKHSRIVQIFQIFKTEFEFNFSK